MRKALHRLVLAAGIVLLASDALAGWSGQPCPGWWTALTNRHGSPVSAAQAFARASGVVQCQSAGMSCSARTNTGPNGGQGLNFVVYDCTNSNNCSVSSNGDVEDTSTFNFGNDL